MVIDELIMNTEPIDRRKPPKKNKKLTKKEKQRLADEYEKLMKAQAEQERLKQLKEERERIEKEKKLAKEKAKREVGEQEIRCQQLSVSCDVFKSLTAQIMQLEEENRAAEEWEKYMKCDGLPDPSSFSQMNTYLYLWQRDQAAENIDKVLVKTQQVIELLDVMDDLITDLPLGVPPSHTLEWTQIRARMREEQQKKVDGATYKILRNIEQNLEMIDLTASKLVKTSPYITLSLWAGIPAPISQAQASQPKQSMTVDFPDVGVSCTLPPSAARHDIVIRALWLRYDHWSDRCPSFDPPTCPTNQLDLEEATLDEWRVKGEMQAAREEEEEERNAKSKGKRQSNQPGPSDAVIQVLDKPVADIYIAKEEEEEVERLASIKKDTGSHEVNLRKNCVLGGVLHLDLLEQPPQPRQLRGEGTITLLDSPPGLNPVEYYEHYVPPPPPEPGTRRTPEEIEVEVKKHEEALDKISSITLNDKKLPAEELRREMEKEKQLQKLLVVSVELPESMLWFEPPMAANWDPINQYWSTEEIHDVKFNEDKQTLTFRSGRMGLMGLVAYRYCNLPYQSWDVKPDMKGPPGGVVLTLTAAVVILEFIIREDKVCLSQLQNGSTGALQEIVGTFYKPKHLIKLLQVGGVDVFPPHDAVCYVAGSTSKHRVAERHLYHCMALFSTCYNFAWSRWNLLAGHRNMVLQMREALDRKRLPNYSVVHISPLRAAVVSCTEVSPSFNEASVDGMPFYADLYTLLINESSKQARAKLDEMPFTLTETVYMLLCATRPLCFS